jgi:hypothetical protein
MLQNMQRNGMRAPRESVFAGLKPRSSAARPHSELDDTLREIKLFEKVIFL